MTALFSLIAIWFTANIVLAVRFERVKNLRFVGKMDNQLPVLSIDDDGNEIFYWNQDLQVYIGGTADFFARTGGGCVVVESGAIFLSDYLHPEDAECVLYHEQGHILMEHVGYNGLGELWEEVQADYYATRMVGKLLQLRRLWRAHQFSNDYCYVPEGMEWQNFRIQVMGVMRLIAILFLV